MPVRFKETDFPGVLLVETGCAADDRGFFAELYSRQMWAQAGFSHEFVQDNLSLSRRGVLRGLHYQIEPHGMGKLIRALSGAVYDVGVDLRKGSPTFGKWFGCELNSATPLALWLPPGFAHGFLAIEQDTLVHYKCTEVHVPEAERALNYADPAIGIQWPFKPRIVSTKDAHAPMLDQAEYNFF
ncbi:MAG: dTDP-4-dehydrorhamnose 3,5-epimerase [Candidatus Hydrogenedentes bacterium]|nr:dTDP-4-dehydrorhamnose 3,5-epimerase [Candidatus Hydrogenedentota bacterium]